MTKQDVQKRINKAIEAYRKQCKKNAAKYLRKYEKNPNDTWLAARASNEQHQANEGTPWSHRYFTRSQYYGNSRGTFAINLINETGHSYRWWKMFARINGKLVLNTFRYSSETSRHISHSKKFLKALRIQYIEVEAPQGLQSLDGAKAYAVLTMGKALVAKKYARKKHPYEIQHAKCLIKQVERIGLIVKQSEIDDAVIHAEKLRRSDLDYAKQRRERSKQRELELQAAETVRVVQPEEIENSPRYHRNKLILVTGGVA